MEKYGDNFILHAPPSWDRAVEVEWEYKTDIFQTRDGSEQRRALREKPRRRIDFSHHVKGEPGRALRSLLAHNARGPMVMADMTMAEDHPSPVTQTVTTLEFENIPYWARTGYPLVVLTGGQSQVRGIQAAHGTTVSLSAPVTVAPTTRIAPGIFGRLTDSSSYERLTNTTGVARFQFQEEPTAMLDPLMPLEHDAQPYFRGFPVFDFRPNWATPVKETFPQLNDVFDTGFGKVFTHLVEAQARWTGAFTCLGRDRREVKRAQDFFFRRKGRRGAFYSPTWQRDMDLVSPPKAGATTVTVKGVDSYELFNGSFVYRNLAFVAREGLVLVGVKSSVISGGNTVFTLDAPLPAQVESTLFASWLLMSRLSSDQFSVVWRTDRVAEFDFNISGLYDRFYELNIALDRITFAGDYLTFPPFPSEAVFIPMTIDGDYLLISQDYVA